MNEPDTLKINRNYKMKAEESLQAKKTYENKLGVFEEQKGLWLEPCESGEVVLDGATRINRGFITGAFETMIKHVNFF